MLVTCDSSGSGGARKAVQHQSTVVGGQLHRTNRSESLDRSHVSGNDVLRHQQRVASQDVPLLSHISPNLSDGKRHTAAAESRLAALKSGQVDLNCCVVLEDECHVLHSATDEFIYYSVGAAGHSLCGMY